MKTKESFEEKSLLPSLLLNEDYSSQENILKELNNFNTQKKEEIQNFEHSFFDSNFSNQNNSISELNESISSKTNNVYKKKKHLIL